jgi:hypothetical protein
MSDVDPGSFLHDVTEILAAFKARDLPPQYLLCGEARFKQVMAVVNDPDSDHSQATVERATSGEYPKALTTVYGLQVVMSRLLPPDFWQVLPDPQVNRPLPIYLGIRRKTL